ncbi:MAG: class I SAM-dependent methyltransferase [Candidatus Jettenia sp.]|uniref:DNA methylase n=1 Tax=Candidatus Jettenia caeni TaxID=247490 RepID=I3ILY5_9BACT|nr:N-6 DNA methylase [Candidatus Jettenia sp. AMX1]MBC6928135.1 class I SAM-dependent methyltransferase [Candidatus Jettenia sp.]NUN23296.1 N-6 DNA methylase [Candidatus Jettenia caeni]KAA0249455.1 MAG: class I SAM-dependent methyltransferase [Candidatus Jettenia sp. AMX1]MCE7879227.1 class I SAM-dependent methyltransferase [Candidatus Jettenia sp. AMX1]MCQ3925956.1 class I SAM-dependent methyltransferase [Candidatus Jettenia sp.]
MNRIAEVLEHIDEIKLRGGYYTPKEITWFICKWAITNSKQKILEPSCGDGNFIEACLDRFKELGIPKNKYYNLIKGIEIIPKEAEKAKARAAKFGLNSDSIVNIDFFEYLSSNGKSSFDVVVGNPPFIRYQNFPEEHRIRAIQMMNALGLKPNKLTNIWVPFLVISSTLLSKIGKLGMVIPAELFQVKYAAETRIFLSNFFERITIVTFNKLVFTGIQQEVVLLLCEKSAPENKGIRMVELSTLADLEGFDFKSIPNILVKPVDHTNEKWTKYFLEENEIRLLRELKNNKDIPRCGDVMKVDVGIVTGRNYFFMLNEKQVEEKELKPYTHKVISKSNHLKGIIFTENDFQINSKAGYPIYLFTPPDNDLKDLPKVCHNYIKFGEAQKFHTGYKCKIRKRWYITPSLWVPDAFVLRQVSDYPKLILNSANASSTDTIHRVKFKNKIDPKLIALSFLNSLTFAFSEITGRSYGGGVLTFEPSEIEELQLPILNNERIDFKKVDQLIRERKIEDILDLTDKELLGKQYGLTESKIKILRNIWRKLSKRRLNRTHNK